MLALGFSAAYGQTTATDFTANDCAGTSHHLFSELDSGKIIVVSFVMPCGACTGPTNTAKTVVNSYASSHPGKVRLYIADDDAATSCPSLTGWGSGNGFSGITTFATTSFVQSQYGAPGMPKIVVLGGSDHHVYLNQNNTLSSTALQTAVNNAIAATTASVQQVKTDMQVSLYPNPAKDEITLSYNLATASDVKMDIYNLIGVKVKTITKERTTAGEQNVVVDLKGLSNGIYFVKLNAGGSQQSVKFTIAN